MHFRDFTNVCLNVLIAQVTFAYSESKRRAKLQYAFNRMRIVTRLNTAHALDS